MDLDRWWHEMHDIGALRATDSLDEAIARVAGRLGGVVDRAHLATLGAGRGAIRHRLETGRLRPVHRGVYAVGHDALTERGRLAAALLAAGRGAALSHRTAAYLWALLPSMPPFVEVTTTQGHRRSRPGLVIHRANDLGARLLHLPVTTPLRTLRDLPRRDLERAASEALVLGLVTHDDLRAAGGRLAELVVGPTRSAFERAFLRAVLQAGLPRPLSDHPIGPYTVDFFWPSHDLVVETDGARYHGHELARRRDHRRDADLQLRGCTVLRVDEVASGVATVAAFLSRPATRTAP